MVRGTRTIAGGVATVAVFVALALPAGAEGPGYGGDATELSVRVLGASEERPTEADDAATERPPASGAAVQVAATGFLAGSTTEVRVGDGAPVTVAADDRGRLDATISTTVADPGGAWVSVTGTDASFQRKVVTATVPADAPAGPPATVLVLGAGAAALAGSAVIGARRGRRSEGCTP